MRIRLTLLFALTTALSLTPPTSAQDLFDQQMIEFLGLEAWAKENLST